MFDPVDYGCYDSDDIAVDDAGFDECSLDVDCEGYDFDDDSASEGSFDFFDVSIEDDDIDGQMSLFDDFDIEEEVSITEDVDSHEETIDTDDEDISIVDTEEEINGQVDIDEYLDYRLDIEHTPTYENPNGHWEDTRGESLFIPNDDTEAHRILTALGLSGVPYKEGKPDFSSVAAAHVLLEQEDMLLGDAAQKEMAAYTLADDIEDDFEDELDNEEELVEPLNEDIINAVLGEVDHEEMYASLLSGEVPKDFVFHHGDANEDGDYRYSLIPSAIHDVCCHRGGRSHSGTKR